MFLQSFEDTIVCSDTWSQCLVAGTHHGGIYLLDEALPWEVKPLFEKQVAIKQIDVCELNGLMVFLTADKGRICIFNLSEFSGVYQYLLNDYASLYQSQQTNTSTNANTSSNVPASSFEKNSSSNSFTNTNSVDATSGVLNGAESAAVKTKLNCKEKRLDFVNGCHLYALSHSMTSTLAK